MKEKKTEKEVNYKTVNSEKMFLFGSAIPLMPVFYSEALSAVFLLFDSMLFTFIL